MDRPIQPSFKIRVFVGKRVHVDTLKGSNVIESSDDNYLDIERFVTWPVTYEEQASLISTLNFEVDKFADVLLYYFHIGQSVIFYGGHYADNQSGMRHVFSGTVTRIKTKFTDNGKVSFSVECMNYGFTKMGKDFKNYVYPDKKSKRKFAQSDKLSVRQIIEGIAKENNIEIGDIDLSSGAKRVNYDKISVSYQKNESDWKYLNKLAQDLGCSCWISNEDGVDKLNFCSNEKAFRKQSKDISFLFPLLTTDKRMDGSIKSSEWQTQNDTSYNRPRLLRDVTVDEDISQAYAVSRSAVYFDKTTGDYKEAISRIETDKDDENKRHITFYELDEQRVAYINKTNPELADKIRKGSPTSLPWGDPKNPNPECASYYYKVTKVYDEQMAVFDKAFFGITVTAKCNQDLNIRSQRTYRIRGILSYHSKSLNTSFFLRGLKHIWDSDGSWTELDFIR